MVNIGLHLPRQVEGLDVWIATVVDESCLVSVEHRVEAERKEFIVVDFLDDLLPLI